MHRAANAKMPANAGFGPGPVYVLNTNTERETGRKAQLSNIEATKSVADVIRTCLGPQAMLKMVMDPMGGIVITNDGNAILREVEVIHPAAKSMLELCRAQDEEVGDGTTSVIILTAEILASVAMYLEPARHLHPTVIIAALRKALKDAMEILRNQLAITIDVNDDARLYALLDATVDVGTHEARLIKKMAVKAVRTVAIVSGAHTRQEADIKQYAKVEKIPGGDVSESAVLDGVVFNKDIIHPTMRRRIVKPRVLLIDCPLEYKKGESQTSMEISKEADWQTALALEEKQISEAVAHIVALKPDVLISEKGISDLAQHHLARANISAIRRVRKTDNNRIARAVGATIVNRLEDARPSDIGHGCGLFEVRKLGDEYFTFMVECDAPKACSILLRGPSKDVLNETERSLQDAMCAVRNVLFDPQLVPGAGASEMAISVALEEKARALQGVQRGPYRAMASALTVIPRMLVQNAGGDAVRLLADLHAKHVLAGDKIYSENDLNQKIIWGVDGINGTLVPMKRHDGGDGDGIADVTSIWESLAVKSQTIKTAVEAACMILRVDDIVAGLTPSQDQKQPAAASE